MKYEMSNAYYAYLYAFFVLRMTNDFQFEYVQITVTHTRLMFMNDRAFGDKYGILRQTLVKIIYVGL